MINCWILDDQYGERIYNSLKDWDYMNYPIKRNVTSPLPYLEKIQDGDIILLDNYYPGETREEPLGDTFLEGYLNKWLSCQIVCISDYGERLTEQYTNRHEAEEKWDIIGYVPDKDGNKIKRITAWHRGTNWYKEVEHLWLKRIPWE